MVSASEASNELPNEAHRAESSTASAAANPVDAAFSALRSSTTDLKNRVDAMDTAKDDDDEWLECWGPKPGTREYQEQYGQEDSSGSKSQPSRPSVVQQSGSQPSFSFCSVKFDTATRSADTGNHRSAEYDAAELSTTKHNAADAAEYDAAEYDAAEHAAAEYDAAEYRAAEHEPAKRDAA